MLEHSACGTHAYRAGSTSYGTYPRNTRSRSLPPFRPSFSNTRQRAQSTIPESASQSDNLTTHNHSISSSHVCSFSEPDDASAADTLLPIDFISDPDFGDELAVDSECEDDAGSATKSQPSVSTAQLCRRLQDRLDSQQLSRHSQLDAINELVEEIVTTKSQCNVTTPSSTLQPIPGPSYVPTPDTFAADDNMVPDTIDDDDEGFCDGGSEYDEEINTYRLLMSLRRASATSRIRKNGNAPGTVYCKPRMRRRIVRRKRPENRVDNEPEIGI